jgi:hypothetical protein
LDGTRTPDAGEDVHLDGTPTPGTDPGSETTVLADFETGDTSELTTNNTLEVETDRVNSGTYTGYVTDSGTSADPEATIDLGDAAGQISAFEYYWNETDDSTGGGVKLVNSAGEMELGLATDNPQWEVIDATGENDYTLATQEYDVWIHTRVSNFDWDSSPVTADVTYTRLHDEATNTFLGLELRSGTDITTVELADYSYSSFGGTAIEMWYDDISVTTGDIATTLADFETYDPNDWSRIDPPWDTTSASNAAIAGETSLRGDGPAADTGGLFVSMPGTGLPDYPGIGDAVRLDFRLETEGTDYLRFNLGCQDTGSNDQYQVLLKASGEIEVQVDTGTTTVLGSGTVTGGLAIGTTYRLHLHWRDNGTFEVIVYDRDAAIGNGVQRLRFTTDTADRSYDGGGVGFYIQPNSVVTVDTLERIPEVDHVGEGGQVDLDWTVLGDFETGDLSKWDVRESGFDTVTDRSHGGVTAGFIDDRSRDVDIVAAQYLDPATQPDIIEGWYQETVRSFGQGIRLRNSDGQYEIGAASDNPEWDIDDANGVSEVFNPADETYNHWVRIRFDFDWGASPPTADVEFVRVSDGKRETYSDRPLKQGTDVESLELWNYSFDRWGNGNIVAWFDDIRSAGIGNSRWQASSGQ